MKKVILLLFVAGITFLGCNDNLDNTIVTTPSTTDDFSNSVPRPININTWLYASKLIDGSIGADFIFDTTIVNAAGSEIEVYARLKIPPGAFNGITEIVMIPNFETLSIKLLPEMTFNAEVKHTLRIKGVDLRLYGYDKTGPIDFAYFDDNGGIELIESHLCHVNLEENEIKVMNARLNHFSRYGWIR